jgi:glycosyltransferase involved in cell wall biosynthesis
MRRVLFFVPTLSYGGAEKVVSLVSKKISGSDITIALLENKVSYPFRGTLCDLEIGYLKRHHFLGKIVKFFIALYKVRRFKRENRFDVSISFIPICNILNVLTNGIEDVILTVHVNEEMDQPSNFYGWIYIALMKLCYKRANKIIAVSKSLRNQIVKDYGLDENHTKVIYDPLDSQELRQLSKKPLSEKFRQIFDSPVLINIGRLSFQKGHTHLIRTFRRIQNKHSFVKLIVLGEGHLLSELTSLARSLNLRVYAYNDINAFGTNYDIYFLGFKKNPYPYLKASQLFLFPSLYEGFGMVIIESMLCGTPVIAADCDFGPREILSPMSSVNLHNYKPETTEYGVLMPSFNQFNKGNNKVSNNKLEKMWADTVLSLLMKSNDKNELFPKASQRAEEFDINNLIVEWESLINGQNEK